MYSRAHCWLASNLYFIDRTNWVKLRKIKKHLKKSKATNKYEEYKKNRAAQVMRWREKKTRKNVENWLQNVAIAVRKHVENYTVCNNFERIQNGI